MAPRLYRSRTDRYIGGVCGGLARTYNWDPTLVRIVALLLILGMGSGLLVYLILWAIVPLEPMC
ncbi:PspC domain-containing protein [uncultured Actinomyces sp.]|uniref:PspC domain-containing protein n=1 Tax=uncultured Actinomyces sp. TaxID=249061 RepID=UPI0035A6FC64